LIRCGTPLNPICTSILTACDQHAQGLPRVDGNLILKAYDLARELHDSGTTVISGFHTPARAQVPGFSIVVICRLWGSPHRYIQRDEIHRIYELLHFQYSYFVEIVYHIRCSSSII